jgi:hypothetical protein
VYTVGSVLDIQWVSSENDFIAIRMAHVLPTVDEYVYVFSKFRMPAMLLYTETHGRIYFQKMYPACRRTHGRFTWEI